MAGKSKFVYWNEILELGSSLGYLILIIFCHANQSKDNDYE